MLRRPLDILNFFVVATLLAMAIVAMLMGRMHAAPALPLRCVVMLAGVVGLAALDRKRAALASWPGWARGAFNLVVDFYPIAYVPLVYDALGFLIPALNPVEKDAWLIAADRTIFGVDPAIWLQRLVWWPLTDLLYLAYTTFFFFPLVVGIPLWRRSAAQGMRFLFLVSLTFYVSYAGYALVPAEGPRSTLRSAHLVPLQQTPLSRGIASTLDALERNRVDAFPSGHILITAVCLWTAAQYSRRLFTALLPVGLLLALATIYCRYHYVIDVIAALVLVPVMPPLARWMYDRLNGLQRETRRQNVNVTAA